MTTSVTNERPRLVLIDGYGLIFRAYHALPPTMATRSGEQTNAVFGVASMLLEVIKTQHPEYIAVALEAGRTFRHDSYDGYKATRAEMPEDLRQQIDRVRELITALGIPIFQEPGYEADDVIGSLSRSAADEGYDVIVVTGDSDLLQLVDDHILAVLPGRAPVRRVSLLRRPGGHRSLRLRPGTDPRLQVVGGRHLGQHSGRSRDRRENGQSADRPMGHA
ncbi:MAG: hypothetical protein R2843_04010 [Thermomicrobiales bacterium]